MKRASFAIPLAGMSLTACSDPVSGTWSAVFFDVAFFPFAEIVDINGLVCYEIHTYQIDIESDLSTTLTNVYTADCDDGTFRDTSKRYAGSTVVEGQDKYTIKVDVAGELIVLDCTLVGGAVLSCIGDGAPFQWVRKE
jgi:hypothetical protein